MAKKSKQDRQDRIERLKNEVSQEIGLPEQEKKKEKEYKS